MTIRTTVVENKSRGFTIVELLIVIVVIGILAAISIVAYSGIQDRGRQAKIKSDVSQLNKAILATKTLSGQSVGFVTGSYGTGSDCAQKPAGTDLAGLAKSDMCWVRYISALDKISIASGMNIRNLLDPWGRPYYIDENEAESGPTDCDMDTIGVYQQPFVPSWGSPQAGTSVYVANTTPGC